MAYHALPIIPDMDDDWDVKIYNKNIVSDSDTMNFGKYSLYGNRYGSCIAIFNVDTSTEQFDQAGVIGISSVVPGESYNIDKPRYSIEIDVTKTATRIFARGNVLLENDPEFHSSYKPNEAGYVWERTSGRYMDIEGDFTNTVIAFVQHNEILPVEGFPNGFYIALLDKETNEYTKVELQKRGTPVYKADAPHIPENIIDAEYSTYNNYLSVGRWYGGQGTYTMRGHINYFKFKQWEGRQVS